MCVLRTKTSPSPGLGSGTSTSSKLSGTGQPVGRERSRISRALVGLSMLRIFAYASKMPAEDGGAAARPNSRAMPTHDVTNQPPPLADYDAFASDRPLLDAWQAS